MSENLENELNELLKLGEEAGISDLMEVYGQYEEYVNISNEYLNEFNPKFIFTTSDSTYIKKE